MQKESENSESAKTKIQMQKGYTFRQFAIEVETGPKQQHDLLLLKHFAFSADNDAAIKAALLCFVELLGGMWTCERFYKSYSACSSSARPAQCSILV
jgi:hypothetical protein